MAVARNLEVGIDVEFIRTFAEVEQIIERFLSDREKSSLRASPPDKQQEALCNYWTCKGAYLRTTGIGLIQPLEKVGVLPDPRQPAKLLSTEGNEEASRWSLNVLIHLSGYAATLVVERHSWSLEVGLIGYPVLLL